MAAIFQWFSGVEFILTSPIYPVESTDNLNWSATIIGGTSGFTQFDNIQFAATPQDSTLVAIYLLAPIQVDNIQFSATPQDSNLDVVLLTIPIQVDNIQFTATPQDSALELALVTHDQPAESMDWTARVTGGTLGT